MSIKYLEERLSKLDGECAEACERLALQYTDPEFKILPVAITLLYPEHK